MDESQALSDLHAILARPEYHTQEQVPWWQQLLAPLLQLIWDTLSRFVQLVAASSTGHEGNIGVVVVIVCGVAVLAAAAYLLRAVRLSVVRESDVRRVSLAERRQRSDQLWQEAQRIAAAGQLAEALQLLYLSALYALDEHALLHVEANLTNREHALRLAQANPSLGDTFADLVARYERVRYGHSEVAADSLADFTARAHRVRTATLGRTSPSREEVISPLGKTASP